MNAELNKTEMLMNFSKFIHQFQAETKTLTRKLKRILIKLYRKNVSSLLIKHA